MVASVSGAQRHPAGVRNGAPRYWRRDIKARHAGGSSHEGRPKRCARAEHVCRKSRLGGLRGDGILGDPQLDATPVYSPRLDERNRLTRHTSWAVRSSARTRAWGGYARPGGRTAPIALLGDGGCSCLAGVGAGIRPLVAGSEAYRVKLTNRTRCRPIAAAVFAPNPYSVRQPALPWQKAYGRESPRCQECSPVRPTHAGIELTLVLPRHTEPLRLSLGQPLPDRGRGVGCFAR